MIKFFYGEDEFSIAKEIQKLKVGLKSEEIGLQKSPEEIIERINSKSLFDEKEVIILTEVLKNFSTEQFKNLTKALKEADQEKILLFLEKVAPTKKIKDFFEKEGEIKTFSKPGSQNLITFIKNQVADLDSEISPLAAERLATFVGPNYWQLEEEIKKIVLYKKGGSSDNKSIQVSDIDLLVKSNFEANIFELLDAIAEKNKRKGIRLLNKFLDSGENEMYIFSMILRQFRNIAIAKFEPNIKKEELAKRAGVHPYVAQKSIQQARGFSKQEIIEIYKTLIRVDLELKSENSPKQSLIKIIV